MSRLRDRLGPWLFVAPAAFLILVFIVYPTFWTMRLSLFGGLGFNFNRFVGFDNYVRLLTNDPQFLDLSKFPPGGAVVNNIFWLLVYTPAVIFVGLLVAVLADKVRYEALMKSVVFLPMAIAATAAAIIWLFVYSPDPRIGILNALLTTIRPGAEPISFVGNGLTIGAMPLLALSITTDPRLIAAVNAVLMAGWLLYDLVLGKLFKNEIVGAAVAFIVIAALNWFLAHSLSGRAAFMQLGAMFGTIMVGNVWMRILPAQRRMVAALKEGKTPDAAEAKRAKNASKQNTFMAVPTVFIMISNHFPITYGHRYNWIVLSGLVLAGWFAAKLIRRA